MRFVPIIFSAALLSGIEVACVPPGLFVTAARSSWAAERRRREEKEAMGSFVGKVVRDLADDYGRFSAFVEKTGEAKPTPTPTPWEVRQLVDALIPAIKDLLPKLSAPGTAPSSAVHLLNKYLPSEHYMSSEPGPFNKQFLRFARSLRAIYKESRLGEKGLSRAAVDVEAVREPLYQLIMTIRRGGRN